MHPRLTFLAFLLTATGAAADTVFPISTTAELIAKLSNTGAGSVPDGGVIEMAPGTYVAPNDGFLIFNPDRDFTIRAATPGTVILDGSGSERIFRFIVNNPSLGGAVVFEGLTFRDGLSTQPAFGAAMTMQGAEATFIDCLFDANTNQSTGSGSGAVGVQSGSAALFLRTTWQNNTSLTSGAGAVIVVGSTFWCHQCQFVGNRNNLAGHATTATGGGLVATGQSTVYLSNSRFEANQAGFGGGAIDAKGSFTDAVPVQLVVANSTFVDNVASPHPSVVTGSPTAGGVANLEDNVVARFYNSRLVDNSAQFGGGIASYRAIVEIYDSVLRGNFATGRASTGSTPRGGAIFAVSDDTAADGGNNRQPSSVTIRDSLFHGQVTAARRGTQNAAAHTGGCIFVGGDLNRFLGQNGVPQGGTQAQNSATLDIAGTAFVDCDVEDLIAIGPFGGGVYTVLTASTIDDSLFAGGDASGTLGAGGAMALLRYSDATVTATTFAENSSAGRGGAIFTLGADIDVNGSTFFQNSVPGATVGDSRGAALFTGPQEGAGLGIDGLVRNSRFIDNDGLAIYDDDRTDGTGLYNLVTYRNNEFWGNAFSPSVYRNTVESIVDVAGLNAMVVDRGGGNTTDKAPFNDNDALASQPEVGALLAVPSRIVDQGAAGDAGGATDAYLAYAWSGACAELDGAPLGGSNSGLTAADTGVHSLMVFDNGACSGAPDLDLTATIVQAQDPQATLSASPVMIPTGGSSTLTWGTPGGTFLQSALDQGIGVLGTPSGSVVVSPSLTTNYTCFAITREGGAIAQQRVYVDEEPIEDEIFSDGFESGNTSAWSSTVP